MKGNISDTQSQLYGERFIIKRLKKGLKNKIQMFICEYKHLCINSGCSFTNYIDSATQLQIMKLLIGYVGYCFTHKTHCFNLRSLSYSVIFSICLQLSSYILLPYCFCQFLGPTQQFLYCHLVHAYRSRLFGWMLTSVSHERFDIESNKGCMF